MNARTARQWMVTHEWMIKPMAQAEWIEGKGLLVWLAEVFSALGTGLYLGRSRLQPVVSDRRLLGRRLRLDRHRDLQAAPALPLPRQALALLESVPTVQQRVEDLVVRPRHRLHHDLPGVRRHPAVLQGLIAYDTVTGGGIEAANWVLHGPGRHLLRDDRRLLRLRHELLQERPLLEHRPAALRVPDHGRRRRSGPDHGCRPGHRRRRSSAAPSRSPASCSSSTPSSSSRTWSTPTTSRRSPSCR